MYTCRYQVLRHRCERVTLAFFSHNGLGVLNMTLQHLKEALHCLNIRRATLRSQKATWRCAMLERATRNTHANFADG